METTSKENIALIFGVKVKKLRTDKNLSLQQLSGLTGISVSYLNEIEKGKKYPKSDKITELAKALEVPYDQLVSLKLNRSLSPFSKILNLDILNDLPLETFGIERNMLAGMIAQAPLRIAAFVNTIYEIARNYNLRQEHFYFAALRSYQELHDNYFEEIELSVEKFCAETGFDPNPPVSSTMYVQLLQEKYNYRIEASTFDDYPALKKLRSVLLPHKQPVLRYNARLTAQQKNFLFGRELGFNYLKLDKRPYTTSWLNVESFDHVLNNYKASYFAQALHIDRKTLVKDLEILFANVIWDGSRIVQLLDKYQASPEMLLQRFSNVLPRYFGFNELFFIRFSSREPEKNLREISKEMHLSRQKENFESRQEEQHYQRWITKQMIEVLKQRYESGSTGTLVGAMLASHPDGSSYFVLSIWRPMPELNNNANSVTIGFQLSEAVRKKLNFLSDSTLSETAYGINGKSFEPPASLRKLDQQREMEEAYRSLVKGS